MEVRTASTYTAQASNRVPAHVRFRIPDALHVLALHASAVISDSGGLVFLGPSETGKSTVLRMLSAYTQPLADDTVYLIPRMARKWLVADATGRTLDEPLGEEQALALNGPPLRAIFRLYRTQTPRLEPIDTFQATKYLTKAFLEVKRNLYLGVEAKQQAFTDLVMLARSVQVYRFYFDLSCRTLEIISQTLNLGFPIADCTTTQNHSSKQLR